MKKSIGILAFVLVLSQLGHASPTTDKLSANTGEAELPNPYAHSNVNNLDDDTEKNKKALMMLLPVGHTDENDDPRDEEEEEETEEVEDEPHRSHKTKRCNLFSSRPMVKRIPVANYPRKYMSAESSIDDSLENSIAGKSLFRVASAKEANKILDNIVKSRPTKEEDNDVTYERVSKPRNQDSIKLSMKHTDGLSEKSPKKYFCYCVEKDCGMKKRPPHYAVKKRIGPNTVGKSGYSTNYEIQDERSRFIDSEHVFEASNNLHCPPGTVLMEESDYLPQSSKKQRKQHHHQHRPEQKFSEITLPFNSEAHSSGQPKKNHIPSAGNGKWNRRVYKVDRNSPFAQKLQSAIEQKANQYKLTSSESESTFNNRQGVQNYYNNEQGNFNQYHQAPVAPNLAYPGSYAYPQYPQYPQYGDDLDNQIPLQFEPASQAFVDHRNPSHNQYVPTPLGRNFVDIDQCIKLFGRNFCITTTTAISPAHVPLYASKYDDQHIQQGIAAQWQEDNDYTAKSHQQKASRFQTNTYNADKATTHFHGLEDTRQAEDNLHRSEEYLDDQSEEQYEDHIASKPGHYRVTTSPHRSSHPVNRQFQTSDGTSQTSTSNHKTIGSKHDTSKYIQTTQDSRLRNYDRSDFQSNEESDESTPEPPHKASQLPGWQQVATIHPNIDSENRIDSMSLTTHASNHRKNEKAVSSKYDFYHSNEHEQGGASFQPHIPKKTSSDRQFERNTESAPVDLYSKPRFVASAKVGSNNRYTNSYATMADSRFATKSSLKANERRKQMYPSTIYPTMSAEEIPHDTPEYEETNTEETPWSQYYTTRFGTQDKNIDKHFTTEKSSSTSLNAERFTTEENSYPQFGTKLPEDITNSYNDAHSRNLYYSNANQPIPTRHRAVDDFSSTKTAEQIINENTDTSYLGQSYEDTDMTSDYEERSEEEEVETPIHEYDSFTPITTSHYVGSHSTSPEFLQSENNVLEKSLSDKQTMLRGMRKHLKSTSPTNSAAHNQLRASTSRYTTAATHGNQFGYTTKAADYTLLGESEEDDGFTQENYSTNGIVKMTKNVPTITKTLHDNEDNLENTPIKYYSPNGRILSYIKNHQSPAEFVGSQEKSETSSHSLHVGGSTDNYWTSTGNGGFSSGFEESSEGEAENLNYERAPSRLRGSTEESEYPNPIYHLDVNVEECNDCSTEEDSASKNKLTSPNRPIYFYGEPVESTRFPGSKSRNRGQSEEFINNGYTGVANQLSTETFDRSSQEKKTTHEVTESNESFYNDDTSETLQAGNNKNADDNVSSGLRESTEVSTEKETSSELRTNIHHSDKHYKSATNNAVRGGNTLMTKESQSTSGEESVSTESSEHSNTIHHSNVNVKKQSASPNRPIYLYGESVESTRFPGSKSRNRGQSEEFINNGYTGVANQLSTETFDRSSQEEKTSHEVTESSKSFYNDDTRETLQAGNNKNADDNVSSGLRESTEVSTEKETSSELRTNIHHSDKHYKSATNNAVRGGNTLMTKESQSTSGEESVSTESSEHSNTIHHSNVNVKKQSASPNRPIYLYGEPVESTRFPGSKSRNRGQSEEFINNGYTSASNQLSTETFDRSSQEEKTSHEVTESSESFYNDDTSEILQAGNNKNADDNVSSGLRESTEVSTEEETSSELRTNIRQSDKHYKSATNNDVRGGNTLMTKESQLTSEEESVSTESSEHSNTIHHSNVNVKKQSASPNRPIYLYGEPVESTRFPGSKSRNRGQSEEFIDNGYTSASNQLSTETFDRSSQEEKTSHEVTESSESFYNDDTSEILQAGNNKNADDNVSSGLRESTEVSTEEETSSELRTNIRQSDKHYKSATNNDVRGGNTLMTKESQLTSGEESVSTESSEHSNTIHHSNVNVKKQSASPNRPIYLYGEPVESTRFPGSKSRNRGQSEEFIDNGYTSASNQLSTETFDRSSQEEKTSHEVTESSESFYNDDTSETLQAGNNKNADDNVSSGLRESTEVSTEEETSSELRTNIRQSDKHYKSATNNDVRGGNTLMTKESQLTSEEESVSTESSEHSNTIHHSNVNVKKQSASPNRPIYLYGEPVESTRFPGSKSRNRGQSEEFIDNGYTSASNQLSTETFDRSSQEEKTSHEVTESSESFYNDDTSEILQAGNNKNADDNVSSGLRESTEVSTEEETSSELRTNIRQSDKHYKSATNNDVRGGNTLMTKESQLTSGEESVSTESSEHSNTIHHSNVNVKKQSASPNRPIYLYGEPVESTRFPGSKSRNRGQSEEFIDNGYTSASNQLSTETFDRSSQEEKTSHEVTESSESFYNDDTSETLQAGNNKNADDNVSSGLRESTEVSTEEETSSELRTNIRQSDKHYKSATNNDVRGGNTLMTKESQLTSEEESVSTESSEHSNTIHHSNVNVKKQSASPNRPIYLYGEPVESTRFPGSKSRNRGQSEEFINNGYTSASNQLSTESFDRSSQEEKTSHEVTESSESFYNDDTSETLQAGNNKNADDNVSSALRESTEVSTEEETSSELRTNIRQSDKHYKSATNNDVRGGNTLMTKESQLTSGEESVSTESSEHSNTIHHSNVNVKKQSASPNRPIYLYGEPVESTRFPGSKSRNRGQSEEFIDNGYTSASNQLSTETFDRSSQEEKTSHEVTESSESFYNDDTSETLQAGNNKNADDNVSSGLRESTEVSTEEETSSELRTNIHQSDKHYKSATNNDVRGGNTLMTKESQSTSGEESVSTESSEHSNTIHHLSVNVKRHSASPNLPIYLYGGPVDSTQFPRSKLRNPGQSEEFINNGYTVVANQLRTDTFDRGSQEEKTSHEVTENSVSFYDDNTSGILQAGNNRNADNNVLSRGYVHGESSQESTTQALHRQRAKISKNYGSTQGATTSSRHSTGATSNRVGSLRLPNLASKGGGRPRDDVVKEPRMSSRVASGLRESTEVSTEKETSSELRTNIHQSNKHYKSATNNDVRRGNTPTSEHSTKKAYVTSKYDPTYFGKISLNGVNPSKSSISDLRNTNLFYVGDGVKIPLRIERIADGSYALSISEKIFENVQKRKCPCCVSLEGDIVEERRQSNEAEEKKYSAETTSKGDYNHYLFESPQSTAFPKKSKNRHIRSTSEGEVVVKSVTPVKNFVKKYNLTLNLADDTSHFVIQKNNEEANEIKNIERKSQPRYYGNTKILNLCENNNEIRRDDSEETEKRVIDDDSSNTLSKESNNNKRTEYNYNADTNDFVESLLHIKDVPEDKRAEIVLNALDGLVNSAAEENPSLMDRYSSGNSVEEGPLEDPNEFEGGDQYDLEAMENEIARYGYQKDNPILKRIQLIKAQQNSNAQYQYKYQKNIDQRTKENMKMLKTILRWLRERFLETNSINKG